MDYNSELKSLLDDIETLRQKLYKIIEQKNDNMLDSEVLTASEMLDAAIAKYIILNKIEDKVPSSYFVQQKNRTSLIELR